MAPPVAIITGGSSGIGLALVKHLISLEWKVVIADINPPKESIAEALYIHTDISSWDQQVSMFKEAYNWGQRLDFCALNAGIDDQDDIFSSLSRDVGHPPSEPNTMVFSVNVIGTYYGMKLAAYYMTIPSEGAGKNKPGGKIVVTASGGGLFPIPVLPQYTSSKHALVGLVRAVGRSKAALDANVRINAVCPAIVDTGALPPDLVSKLPRDQITPISTIVRCFDELANFQSVHETNWVEEGHNAETVEGNVHDLIWHHPSMPPIQERGKFDRENAIKIVAQAYEERKREFMEKRG